MAKLRDDVDAWKELKDTFKWYEEHYRSMQEAHEKAKERWDYLHMHIPKLFSLIEKPVRDYLTAYAEGMFIEDIRQILKPFTEHETMHTTWNGVPYWMFELLIAGRSMTFTLYLSDVERYCTKKVKVVPTASETVTYEGCTALFQELAGMEES